jgi:hypothetical protein
VKKEIKRLPTHYRGEKTKYFFKKDCQECIVRRKKMMTKPQRLLTHAHETGGKNKIFKKMIAK